MTNESSPRQGAGESREPTEPTMVPSSDGRSLVCTHTGPDTMMTEDPRGSRGGVPCWLCPDCLKATKEAGESRGTDDAWRATHTLLLTHEDGLVEAVPVMLCRGEGDDGDGPAYTRAEWDSGFSADWEVDGGEWLFQGGTAPPGVVAVEVRRVRA